MIETTNARVFLIADAIIGIALLSRYMSTGKDTGEFRLILDWA